MNSQKEINEKSLKIWKSIDTRIKLEEKGTVDKKKKLPKTKISHQNLQTRSTKVT